MIENIVDWSIRNRLAVLVLAACLSIAGIIAAINLPFDAFPDTTPVMVQVNVAAPGWAAEEIERLVTYPLEQGLTGLTGLAEIRSVTKYGLSQITTIFNDDIDLYLARQQVSERLQAVELPVGIGQPELGPVSTGLGEIFHYVVISSSTDITAARTAQDWIVKPQLQSVSGVAEVNSWGGFEKQYLILFKGERLAQYKLTLEETIEAIEKGISNVPGGQITRGGEMTIVRGIGTVGSVDQVRQLVIATIDGIAISVGDIAEVSIGHESRRGASTFDGRGEAVLGLGFMITGENPADVSTRLSERLEEARKNLPDDVTIMPVYERTTLVHQVLETVEHNLFFGAMLVIAVLFVFLGNFRAGLIVASAIPLSMLFAFDLMSRVGIAGSLMSLGAIDFGLAVDNAVIQVENAVRRLSSSSSESNRLEVIRSAILEVRKPTLFGELIIIVVYLPILTLQGIEGKLFQPMALTVVFVLTGSLLLSFTVIPALAAFVLPRMGHSREPAIVRWLTAVYQPALRWALRHAKLVLIVALAMVITGAALFTRLGSEFVPRLNEGAIAINFVRLAGISLEETISLNTRIEQNLKEEFPDEIDHIWSRCGTAELSTDPMGLELTDMFITLTPRARWTRAKSQSELVTKIDSSLSDIPGQNRIFTQPIEMRVNEMIAGIRSDIGIKLFGDDFSVLEQHGERIALIAKSIDGNSDVTVEQLTGQQQLQLSLDRERLSRFGLTASEVLLAIETIGGVKVGDVFESTRRFDLVLRIDTSGISGVEDIKRIFVQSPTGASVGLDQLTTGHLEIGPSTITREWSQRRIVVSCNVRNRDVGSFVEELRNRIDKEISLPAGYFVRFGGQFENLERARARLLLVVPIALALIFALLYLTYRSWGDAVLIFTGIPLAALGGVLTLFLRGMPFSISAGVGFIALSGIAVLNGLVLVSAIHRNRSEGDELEEAISRSAIGRLRPVCMTALVAAIGFLPMAVSTSIGAEVQRPLASVVIGGVLTSTALTLIILPALYLVFRRQKVTP